MTSSSPSASQPENSSASVSQLPSSRLLHFQRAPRQKLSPKSSALSSSPSFPCHSRRTSRTKSELSNQRLSTGRPKNSSASVFDQALRLREAFQAPRLRHQAPPPSSLAQGSLPSSTAISDLPLRAPSTRAPFPSHSALSIRVTQPQGTLRSIQLRLRAHLRAPAPELGLPELFLHRPAISLSDEIFWVPSNRIEEQQVRDWTLQLRRISRPTSVIFKLCLRGAMPFFDNDESGPSSVRTRTSSQSSPSSELRLIQALHLRASFSSPGSKLRVLSLSHSALSTQAIWLQSSAPSSPSTGWPKSFSASVFDDFLGQARVPRSRLELPSSSPPASSDEIVSRSTKASAPALLHEFSPMSGAPSSSHAYLLLLSSEEVASVIRPTTTSQIRALQSN